MEIKGETFITIGVLRAAYWSLLIGSFITFFGFGLIQEFYCDYCVATGISPPVWSNVICVCIVCVPLTGLSMVADAIVLLVRLKKQKKL